MRHMITQQHAMGCGVACVAFAAQVTYRQAEIILGSKKAQTVGFHLHEMVTALFILGQDYEYKHMKPKLKPSLYQEGVIVFIRRSPRYPYGHYLIRYKGKWGDPWINLVLNKNLTQAMSGYRRRVPGKVQWLILPKDIF